MARVQYGVIVTELKGKIAGQVFQGGNVGYVLRNKGYTPGHSSPQRQQANRNLITNTTAWRLLSDAERAAWAAIVADWTFLDKFGNTYQGSGFQVYNSYNTTRISIGLSPLDTPLAVQSPTDPGEIVIVAEAMGALMVDWENAGGANDYITIFASPAISAGRNGNNVKLTKLFGGSINGLTNKDVYAEYAAIFGDLVLGSTIKVHAVFRDGRWPRNTFTQSVLSVVVAP